MPRLQPVLLALLAVALAVVASFSSLPGASASPLWGFQGHQLTASVAQAFLYQGTTQETNALLSNVSGQLSAISTWADSVRSSKQYSWSASYHYADTEDWSCEYVDSDCPKSGCVVTAILNYTEQLRSRNEQTQEIALRFDVHFHGDIHQPLHCGFLGDKGGNSITGTFYGDPANLHQVWDSGLIEMRMQNDFDNNQEQYVSYLVSRINGEWKSQRSNWLKCTKGDYPCPAEWANESAKLACSNAYVDQNGNKIEDGFELGAAYYERNKDVVDLQLAKGGYRLAATLNQVWGDDVLLLNNVEPRPFRPFGARLMNKLLDSIRSE